MKRHLNSVTDQLNWATRQKYNYDPNCLPSHWLPEVPNCEALSYLCDSLNWYPPPPQNRHLKSANTSSLVTTGTESG